MTPNHEGEYLHILSIFHYVVAGVSAVFACFPILHFILGVMMASGALSNPAEPGPEVLFGLFFAAIAGIAILLGWAFALLVFLTGRFIALRRHHMFCLVMAGVECVFTPFGTVLGVLTIILLVRDSVRDLFGIPPKSPAPIPS